MVGDKISRREMLQTGARILVGAAAGSGLGSLLPACSDQAAAPDFMAAARPADIRNIRLTVIYDNIDLRNGLASDWGFSCLVRGTDKTVLFDTGQTGRLLMENMGKLEIDPGHIHTLVISHDHEDHAGGAMTLLDTRTGVNVAVVKSFPSGFKTAVLEKGSHVTEISRPQLLTQDCVSTGEMKSLVRNEHSLIVLTDRGSIVITGCSHPGIVAIVERARQVTGQEVRLVMGGFHLLNQFTPKIRKITGRLKELGVQFVAPSHCSGSEAFEVMSKAFGDRFIHSGLGRVITARDLGIPV